MSGLELIQQLRMLPDLADTRFLAISGYGSPDHMATSKAAGFHAHFAKPIDFDLLKSHL